MSARESELVTWFLQQADGCPMAALRLAVACCERMALATSRGMVRSPPDYPTRDPKPPKPSILTTGEQP